MQSSLGGQMGISFSRVFLILIFLTSALSAKEKDEVLCDLTPVVGPPIDLKIELFKSALEGKAAADIYIDEGYIGSAVAVYSILKGTLSVYHVDDEVREGGRIFQQNITEFCFAENAGIRCKKEHKDVSYDIFGEQYGETLTRSRGTYKIVENGTTKSGNFDCTASGPTIDLIINNYF